MFKKDQLNQIAVPLMLSNVLSLVISLCDQAMIGHLSISSFAAVGIVAGFINGISGVLGATSISFNILAAKAYRNNLLFTAYVQSQLVLSIAIGIISYGFIWCSKEFIFHQLYQLTHQVLIDALSYAKIFSLSIGLNLVLFTASIYLKITNQTKYILVGSVVAAISNVVLDWVFIYALDLGMIGNAIGSILALCLNLFIYLFFLRHEWCWKHFVVKLDLMKKCLSHSMSFMIQEFLESTILVLMLNILLSRIGLLEVSIFQFINNLLEISWMPMYAYSQAMLTIVSKSPQTLMIMKKEAVIRSLRLYSLIAVIFLLNRGWILSLLTNQQLLINQCNRILPVVFLLYIFRHHLMMNQTCLQTLGEQQWILKVTFSSYLFGYFIIFLLIRLYPSLWIIYLGLAIIYFSLMCMMEIKLKMKNYR